MPAFSKRDFLARIAEILGVIDIDAGDDRAVGIEDVDRVEAAAQADFEDHRVQSARGEQAHDRQRREFEVGQRDRFGEAQARGFDGFEMRQQVCVARHFAVHARPLVERQQMRRRVTADREAGAQQNRFEDRAGRALAVGAADRDDRARERQLHRVTYLRDAFQTHVDADRMRGFKVREPRVEGGECGHRANLCCVARS